MKLTDKTIVITGAASGIGRALALRFAAERPRALVLADLPRQSAALEALAAALSRDGPATWASRPTYARWSPPPTASAASTCSSRTPA